MTETLDLFPGPKQWTPTGGTSSAGTVSWRTDASLPPEGFVLTATDAGVTVDHADDRGRRWAAQALSALVAAGPVPNGRLVDHPTIAVRGYMLDISRDRVPTRETLDWLVGVLEALRFNELQLYTEHTFAWADHEIVWRDASPTTAEDLVWLAGRCESSGIALVPCLNGFGHMERFLRHDRYRSRAECPDGVELPGWPGRRPPTTLAPTPDNAAFALDLIREYLAARPTGLVHIGGDEPFELGSGTSAAAVAARGRDAVYLEHLRRITDPLIADGHELIFWGDVLRTAPHLVARLPGEGLTAAVWHYDAPDPDAPPLSSVVGPEVAAMLGMPEDGMRGFAAHVRSFVETGFPFRVAAGTSTWNSLIGRWPNARANIDDAVVTAAEHGVDACQLTDWGDNGHHHPLAISLLPMAWAAGAMWSGPGATTEEAVEASVDRITGSTGSGALLRRLGEVHGRLGVRAMNASPLCRAVLGPVRVRPEHLAPDDEVRDVLAFLESAGQTGAAIPRVGDELAAVIGLARVGVERLAAAAGRPTRSSREVDADLVEAVDRQREAWLGSSRPGGLDDSLDRILATLGTGEP